MEINAIQLKPFKPNPEKQRHPNALLHYSPLSKPPATSLQVKSALGGAKQLIESGTVKAIEPREASKAIENDSYKIFDIRPEWERSKARVPGSLHVPLFIQDTDYSPLTLLKKWVHFGYIGLWTGQQFTAINPEFVPKVEELVPDKDTKLLVACGEGLRSMMATAKLHKAGYSNLGWLVGGFSRAKDGDFRVEGTEKLQYATIGGVSYYFLKLLVLLQAISFWGCLLLHGFLIYKAPCGSMVPI